MAHLKALEKFRAYIESKEISERDRFAPQPGASVCIPVAAGLKLFAQGNRRDA
jgi:hypothetical protein